ncbi:hypothetical protein B0I31_113138 [Saccharothrix carnea]|uniref:Uncharacterized protein n=1 Tax=Saccharothrix carnea TaxID=1280637 RepID=A0A2P8I1Y4_SACCR|nr:hypothetical protein B0I31_113138 [Saccharothrix carnea]
MSQVLLPCLRQESFRGTPANSPQTCRLHDDLLRELKARHSSTVISCLVGGSALSVTIANDTR